MNERQTTQVADPPVASCPGESGRAIDVVAVGYVAQDPLGTIVDCNPAALRLLGLEATELLGRTSLDPRWRAIGSDGADLPGHAHPAMVTLATGRPVDDFVMGVRRVDGSLIWLGVSSRLLDPGRDDSGVATTFVDVTRERALRHAYAVTDGADHVLLRSTSMDELASEMCQVVVRCGHILAWIARSGPDDNDAVSVVATAGATDYLYDGIVSQSAAEARGRGPVGTALREHRPMLISDVETAADFAPWSERARSFGIGSVIAIPFRWVDETAVLAIYSREPEAFNAESLAVLAHLGENLEFGVRNLDRVQRLHVSLQSTVHTMTNLVELRDSYTAGHQRRVADLSVAIGRELGLRPDTLDVLGLGALVHDIGKIAVPAEILAKHGPLRPAEWELIKTHAEVGEALLRDGSLPTPVPEIAGQHHERFDGTGYPRRLRGDEICLEARIVAVADVVEAMAHHRPYRPALGIELALGAVIAGAGSLFDPDVVRACELVMRRESPFGDPATP